MASRLAPIQQPDRSTDSASSSAPPADGFSLLTRGKRRTPQVGTVSGRGPTSVWRICLPDITVVVDWTYNTKLLTYCLAEVDCFHNEICASSFVKVHFTSVWRQWTAFITKPVPVGFVKVHFTFVWRKWTTFVTESVLVGFGKSPFHVCLEEVDHFRNGICASRFW